MMLVNSPSAEQRYSREFLWTRAPFVAACRQPVGSLLAAHWQPNGTLLAAHGQPVGTLKAARWLPIASHSKLIEFGPSEP
jgi:hypothetical protein